MIIFKSYYFVRRKYWTIRWYIGYYIYWPLKNAIYWPIKIFLMDKWWDYIEDPDNGFKAKFKVYKKTKRKDLIKFFVGLRSILNTFFVFRLPGIFKKIKVIFGWLPYKLFILRHKYLLNYLPKFKGIPSIRVGNYFLLWALASISSYLNYFSFYKEKIYIAYIMPLFKSFNYDSQQVLASKDLVDANHLGFQKLDGWLNGVIKAENKMAKQKSVKIKRKAKRIRRSIYIASQPQPPYVAPRPDIMEVDPRVPTRYQEISHYIFIRWNRLRIFVMATFLMFKFYLIRFITVYGGYAPLVGVCYKYWVKFRYSLRFGSLFSEYLAFLWPLLILSISLYYTIGFIIVHFFLTPFFPGFVFGWRMYLGLVLLWFATLEHFAFSDWSQIVRDQRNDYFMVRKNRFLEHFAERTEVHDSRKWEMSYEPYRRKGWEIFIHFRGVYLDNPPLF